MTVLIVDDNPGVRRLLQRLVLDTASSVWECSDGDEAVAAPRQYVSVEVQKASGTACFYMRFDRPGTAVIEERVETYAGS